MPRRASLGLAVPLLLALALGAAGARADWGADLEAGQGPRMVGEVQGDLLEIVKATPGERVAKIRSFFTRGAKHMVEALKRYRNPELTDLFRTFLDHPDWHVQHRGLLALEALGDEDAIDRAWRFLDHPERRLREKAALTCILLWDGRTPPGDVEALLTRERVPHVRRCLEALRERIAGRLVVETLQPEHVETLANGLCLVPFLADMADLPRVAPGYRAQPTSAAGKGSPPDLSTDDAWTTPLLGWGEEEIPTTALEPFGNLGQDGLVRHVGQDVGACLDGAGVYAPARGLVRWLASGSDQGTVIVLEHQLPGGRVVNGVYLHCGRTVFVRPGDVVACGQLLGTIGLGFSLENGAHVPLLHYGLYAGAFDATKTTARLPVSSGLEGFLDPAEFLAAWEERTTSPMPNLLAPDASLLDTLAKAEHGEYGRAYAEALRRRDAQDRHSEAWADADELVQALETVPRRTLRRAEALLEGGYPAEALALLDDVERAAHGIPRVEQLGEQSDEWRADEKVKRAVKGQKKVAAAEAKAVRERDPSKTRKAFEKLLEEYGDTCLEARIRTGLGA